MKFKVSIFSMQFLLLLFVLSSSQVNAAILTVSNWPAGGSQYTNLNDAITAASANDTLLVEGTNIEYTMDGSTFNKPIVFIGAGLNADKEAPRRTRFGMNSIYNEFRLYAANSGSKFYGIDFTRALNHMDHNINNLYFENCMFESYYNFQNKNANSIAFLNCIFETDGSYNILIGGTTNVISGILIKSCIFDGYIDGSSNPFTSIIIDHCLFLSASQLFYGLYYTTFSNCIFRNEFPSGVTSCTFLKNLSAVAGTFPPSGGNSASGNIENTDPLFVSYSPVYYWSPYYSSAYNFKLQAGSAAIAAASDGTDIGIYGGNSNFSGANEPLIAPVVRSVIIQNPVTAPNSTLNVDVKASKPRTN